MSIFPNANSYPEFFKSNLVDPSRVIKVVQGGDSVERAFYYQLLKLVFELEVDHDGTPVDYEKIVPEIIRSLVGSTCGADIDVVEKFIELVSSKEDSEFESEIYNHFEVDHSFVRVMKEILGRGGKSGGAVEDKLQYLGEVFKERLVKIDQCIKFEESDVFIYIENSHTLYLAFLKLDEEPDPERSHSKSQESENSIEKAIYTHNPRTNIGGKMEGQRTKTQNDTIINIIGDMMVSSKNEGDSKVSSSGVHNLLTNSLSPKREDTWEKSKGDRNAVDRGNKFENNESRVSSYHEEVKTTFSKNLNNQNYRKESPEEIHYRPHNPLKTISEVTASRESMLYSQKKKKDPLDYAEEEEKGTFYRQFTDTRILNILPEPQRTTVKMIKNRFIGVHGRKGENRF